jgi:class 3 adenylate cyclase
MKRFIEEFLLYSSQLVVFFIIMLFLTPSSSDALGALPLVIVAIFLFLQVVLLVGQGHNPILRFLFSFISPAAYALVRVIAGEFVIFDMANVFLWGAALYVGLFQAIAIASRMRALRRLAETFLALGAILVFVFFYFYLDLRLSITGALRSGAIDLAAYQQALDIRAFLPAFLRFIRTAQNAFFVYGAATFGLMILAGKVEALSLRSRISGLFGEAKLQGPSPQAGIVQAQQVDVTVLSADIWDFSLLSDRLSAKGAVDILNRYYALWETLAERHRGRVVDLTGDTVLVAFGLPSSSSAAPSPQDSKDMSERAVACAFDFLGELPGLRSDLAAASMPPFGTVGIGIHAGKVVAGDLGLKDSRALGVFGDAVSVAARLDSLCKEFKQELLLSQPVFKQLGLETQSRFLSLGEVLLRNSTQPVPVYGRK